MRIARDDDAIVGQKDQRKCAFDLQQRIAQRAGERTFARARDQVENDFGIAGGLEDRAIFFQLAPQLDRVGQISVVRNRDLAFTTSH